MNNEYLKYFKPKVLIALVALLTAGLLAVKIHWGISASILGVITGILSLVATKLWKKKWLNWMFWVDDLSGKYEGKLRYRFLLDGVEKSGELKHVKVINQNGYRISVSSFTYKVDGSPSSSSANLGMYVEKTRDEKHFRLLYNYLNEGSTEQGFPPHYGTEILKVYKNGNGKVLSGRYFTEREPQTKGDFIEMEWISDDLSHEF